MDENPGSEFGVKRIAVHQAKLGHVVVITVSRKVGKALRASEDADLRDFKNAPPKAAMERLANNYWARIGRSTQP